MPIARLNDHDMYFEIHGEGRAEDHTVLCSGGWGTFCHGNVRHLPEGLLDRYQVVIFDHRGLCESTDDAGVPASTALYAADVVALMDHLEIESVHMLGIAGIGSCLGQELAIARPERVRSLIMSGTWARADDYFRAQLELWRRMHREMGFAAFQQEIVLAAYDPAFYVRHQDRLLGPNGGWSELRDNYPAHDRLTDAALGHDSVDRLAGIRAPSLVIHAGRDMLTAPRLSLPVEEGIPDAQGWMMGDSAHVVTDRGSREEFARRILDFLRDTARAGDHSRPST
jgi:pimeloyl-ACP methyl ester carboxylesterase